MDIKSEIYRCFEEIDNLIMEYRSKNANDPKYLVLPMEHRQALRLNYAGAMKKKVYDIPEITKYFGFTIIKKEEAIIVDSKE